MQSPADEEKQTSVVINALPLANDILPRSAPRRENPVFAVGEGYLNLIPLEGAQPGREALGEFVSKKSQVLSSSPGKQQSQHSFNLFRSPRQQSVSTLPDSRYLSRLEDLKIYHSMVYSKFNQSSEIVFNSVQFSRSNQRPAPPASLSGSSNNALQQQQLPSSPSLLTFESRFESGNLSFAFERAPRNYILVMQNDINTTGCTQWFYYRVSNGSTTGRVDFEIVNFQKPYSLFSQGMKIMLFSEAKRKQVGWHRACIDIKYIPNGFIRKKGSITKPYYSLHFSYVFDHAEDYVYFAYNYPYTYSQLQKDLFSLENDNSKTSFITRTSLTKTLAGNKVDLLTITDPQTNRLLSKQTIIVSARVHPGETVSSFMVKGLIDYLLGESDNAHYLRNHFIFKIIPMLNPDGVIHGNYRCSLSGKDLNRQWSSPDKETFPEIFALKQLIIRCTSLQLFCDLHGHSIKKNIFVYGCHDNSKPSACRELPYLLSKLYQPFSYKDCNFKVRAEKLGTARVVLWKCLKNPNIFTVESSFCGPSYGNVHFGMRDLQSMGHALCEAIAIYFHPSIPSANLLDEDELLLLDIPGKPTQSTMPTREDIHRELHANNNLLFSGMDDSAGSDSDPSEDELEEKTTLAGKEKKTVMIASPKKVLRHLPTKVIVVKKLDNGLDHAGRVQDQISNKQIFDTFSSQLQEPSKELFIDTLREETHGEGSGYFDDSDRLPNIEAKGIFVRNYRGRSVNFKSAYSQMSPQQRFERQIHIEQLQDQLQQQEHLKLQLQQQQLLQSQTKLQLKRRIRLEARSIDIQVIEIDANKQASTEAAAVSPGGRKMTLTEQSIYGYSLLADSHSNSGKQAGSFLPRISQRRKVSFQRCQAEETDNLAKEGLCVYSRRQWMSNSIVSEYSANSVDSIEDKQQIRRRSGGVRSGSESLGGENFYRGVGQQSSSVYLAGKQREMSFSQINNNFNECVDKERALLEMERKQVKRHYALQKIITLDDKQLNEDRERSRLIIFDKRKSQQQPLSYLQPRPSLANAAERKTGVKLCRQEKKMSLKGQFKLTSDNQKQEEVRQSISFARNHRDETQLVQQPQQYFNHNSYIV